MKIAAVLLGPAGVGLIGLFQQVVSMTSTLFGLGLRQSGTRQIANAQAANAVQEVANTRRALFWGTLFLAIAAGTVFLFIREVLVEHVATNTVPEHELGWLAIGVILSVGASSQEALLNGLREVRAIALLTVISGAFSAAIAALALFLMREQAIVIFVIASPLASFVLGHWFVSRLPPIEIPSRPLLEVCEEFRKMVVLGSSIMLASLVTLAGHLAIRTFIQRELGTESLGLFTAAWLISQYSITFLYSAITMDYYPRLTAVISDKGLACRIINEQTQIGLLFAAPLFLGIVALAPYALWLLYAEEFMEASALLRWFILGDVLKVVAQPMTVALTALSAGRSYFVLHLAGMIVYLVFALVLMQVYGISGAGQVYLVMDVFHLGAACFLLRRRLNFRFSSENLYTPGLLVTLCAGVSLLPAWLPVSVPLVGSIITFIVLGYSAARLYKWNDLRGEKF